MKQPHKHAELIKVMDELQSKYDGLHKAISSMVERDLTYVDGKVSDGLYWTDIQCMRNYLREFPL